MAAKIGRQQKDFAQILQLVMWIRTILFAVGAHKPASSFIHAIVRMDTFKGKKSIGILLYRIPAEVSQKKELQEEEFWPLVFPSTVQKLQDQNCGFD